MMCALLWYASRNLFVGVPRDSGGFDSTSSIFENTVASKFSCEAFPHTAFSVLFSASS